jgi:poly-gamma-glutamate synthesis protein (capsule biosynthesis protein)
MARKLVEAGAALVVGHHPHVLQGMERHGEGAIVYSLGNFIASEVLFTSGDKVTWNRTERTGCILRAELDGKKLLSVEQIPTYDSGQSVEIDRTDFGRKHIARLNQALERGITLKRYRWEHFRVMTLRPILRYLKWSRLKTLRWRQIKNALAGIFHSARAE